MHIVGLRSSKKKKRKKQPLASSSLMLRAETESILLLWIFVLFLFWGFFLFETPTSTLSAHCLLPQLPCCSQEETDPGCVDTTVSEETREALGNDLFSRPLPCFEHDCVAHISRRSRSRPPLEADSGTEPDSGTLVFTLIKWIRLQGSSALYPFPAASCKTIPTREPYGVIKRDHKLSTWKTRRGKKLRLRTNRCLHIQQSEPEARQRREDFLSA